MCVCVLGAPNLMVEADEKEITRKMKETVKRQRVVKVMKDWLNLGAA